MAIEDPHEGRSARTGERSLMWSSPVKKARLLRAAACSNVPSRKTVTHLFSSLLAALKYELLPRSQAVGWL